MCDTLWRESRDVRTLMRSYLKSRSGAVWMRTKHDKERYLEKMSKSLHHRPGHPRTSDLHFHRRHKTHVGRPPFRATTMFKAIIYSHIGLNAASSAFSPPQFPPRGRACGNTPSLNPSPMFSGRTVCVPSTCRGHKAAVKNSTTLHLFFLSLNFSKKSSVFFLYMTICTNNIIFSNTLVPYDPRM